MCKAATHVGGGTNRVEKEVSSQNLGNVAAQAQNQENPTGCMECGHIGSTAHVGHQLSWSSGHKEAWACAFCQLLWLRTLCLDLESYVHSRVQLPSGTKGHRLRCEGFQQMLAFLGN